MKGGCILEHCWNVVTHAECWDCMANQMLAQVQFWSKIDIVLVWFQADLLRRECHEIQVDYFHLFKRQIPNLRSDFYFQSKSIGGNVVLNLLLSCSSPLQWISTLLRKPLNSGRLLCYVSEMSLPYVLHSSLHVLC